MTFLSCRNHLASLTLWITLTGCCTAGNGVLSSTQRLDDNAFSGFTSGDAAARAIIPDDATTLANGGLVIGDTPVLLNGFTPGKQVTLTLDATVPEAEGTVIGVKSGTNHLKLARASDGSAECFYNGAYSTDDNAVAPTFLLTAGRHRIVLTYDTTKSASEHTATSGTHVWVDGTLAYRSQKLIWSQSSVSSLTLGGDASDALGTPMRGLIVHSADLRMNVGPRFSCTDTGAMLSTPADATLNADGSLTLTATPLTISGFTASAQVTASFFADVPESATGTLFGCTAIQNGTTHTVQAERSGSTACNLRYDGTNAHGSTSITPCANAGRHVFTFIHSASSGTELWQDGECVVSATGIKWGNSTVGKVTVGATATETPGLPFTGLRVYAVSVDTVTAIAPEDPLSELYAFPDALASAGLDVKRHLATIAGRSDGSVSVPEVTLNGARLGELDAARALWFFEQNSAVDLRFDVSDFTVGENGALSLTLNNPKTQHHGSLSLLGATSLESPWTRLMVVPAPVAPDHTFAADKTFTAAGYTFFKVRAEEGSPAIGPLASLAPAPSPAGEGMPACGGESTVDLFAFTLSGDAAELSATQLSALTFTLEGDALTLGETYTLTIDGNAYTAVLLPDAETRTATGKIRGILTFTELAPPTSQSAIRLSGCGLRAGTVTLVENSWGAALNSQTTHVVAVLARDLVTDGFVKPGVFSGTGANTLMYRIPALATDGNGSVVAIYDVRYGSGDLGDRNCSGIDLGENHSSDGGNTWSKPRLAVDVPNFRGPDGTWPYGSNRNAITKAMDIGDAAILYDPGKTRYWLMAITGGGLSTVGTNSGKNDCVLYTRDSGADDPWQEWTGGPDGNSRSVKQMLLEGIGKVSAPGRGILAGPGHGIVTRIGRSGMPKGTLVFPMQAFVNSGTGDAQCFAAYSLDGGDTWKATGLTPKSLAQTPHNVQENCVMELDDGSWLMMSKGGSWGAGNGRRLFFRTTDFVTWTQLASIPNVIHVQGSCLRIGTGSDGKGRYVLAHQLDPGTRAKLALVFGRDLTETNTAANSEGVEWNFANPHMLHKDETGGMGYNSLCMLDDTTLGILYETNGKIYFARIDVSPYLE